MTTSEQKNIIKPDPISLTTHQLVIGFKPTDTVLAWGTGFTYKLQDKYYLITNWHNVTGRNPIAKKPIADHAGIPDMFSTTFREKGNPGVCYRNEVRLYFDDEMTKPKWLIHPTFRENVDVVAIELEPALTNKYSFFPINENDFDNDIPPEISDSVFIIGYPFDEPQYIELPIWKKGSIATEPTVNRDQTPKLLIDTATRPGLSGSPVIYQRTGIHKMFDGKLKDDSIIGRIRNFLGIYSGRLGKDEFQAQLGIVWKAKVIEEIINGQIYGDIEFQKY